MKKIILPYKWELVILLWVAFFFNQADRQIFNVVLPLIRDDLHLTDADMGLVASVLTLLYGILVPIAGLIGDRISKKKIIIISLFVWSGATLLTGISTTLIELIILRSVATGGGEAFYSPSANSSISEVHDERTRATALSIHQTALYVGIISSGYIAGALAEILGWRHTFYLFGGFGILLGIILHFRMKDSINTQISNTSNEEITIKETLSAFFKKPTAILLSLAFAGMQFVGVGFLTWMPTFLHENFYFSLARAGFDSTFYHHVGAFVGVILGARVADKFVHKYHKMRVSIQATGLLLGAPFIYLMAKSSSILIIYISMLLFGIFRGMFDSNIFASLYQVIPVKYRAASTGFMLMFAFIIGSISPYLLGLYKPIFGLENGLASLSIIYIVASAIIFIAIAFTFSRDYLKQDVSDNY
jgi:MFS family permease